LRVRRIGGGVSDNSIGQESQTEHASHNPSRGGRLDFSTDLSEDSDRKERQSSQDQDICQGCVHKMGKQIAHFFAPSTELTEIRRSLRLQKYIRSVARTVSRTVTV